MGITKQSTRSDFIREYIADKYGTYSTRSISSVYAPLNRAELYAEEIGKPLTSFTKDDYVALFVKSEWTVARGSFSANKSRLFQYLRYQANKFDIVDTELQRSLFDLQSMTIQDLQIDSDMDSKYYFASENEFIQYLKDNVPILYTKAKIIYILYWYGFTMNQVSDVKLSDFDRTKNSVCGVIMAKETFQYLYSLSKISSFFYTDSIGREYHVAFVDSKYVICHTERAAKKKSNASLDGKVQPKDIPAIVRLPNSYILENKKTDIKQFHRLSLAANKLFCDMFQYEQEKSIDIASDTIPYTSSADMPCGKMNSDVYYNFTQRYLQWRKMYHNM